MNMKRHQRWVRGSFVLAKFEQFSISMVSVAQALGRLDCKLVADDQQFLTLSEKDHEREDEIMRLNDRLTMSYLWVLGSYELVRTLDQRASTKPESLSTELREVVVQLKRRFTSPEANASAESPSALPTASRRHSSWQLTDCIAASALWAPTTGAWQHAWAPARPLPPPRTSSRVCSMPSLPKARSSSNARKTITMFSMGRSWHRTARTTDRPRSVSTVRPN